MGHSNFQRIAWTVFFSTAWFAVGAQGGRIALAADAPAATQTGDYRLRVEPPAVSLELGEPVVVAQAPAELDRAGAAWGRWQFPFLRRMADGRLHASFSVEPDAASSYGKPMGHAYSTDEGQTWRVGPPQVGHEAEDGVLLPNGERLQPVQRPARRGEEFDLPQSVCDYVCSFGFQTSLYRAEDLPAEVSEWRFRRLPAGGGAWREEVAAMRIPDQLCKVIDESGRGAAARVGGIEQVRKGELPTPFLWGKVRVAPDGSLWAVTYATRWRAGRPVYAPLFVRSIDHGHTWDFLGEIAYQGDATADRQADKREGFTEPDFNFRPDGSVICLMRTSDGNGHGPLYLTRSVDGARTWSRPVPFDLGFDGGKMPQLLTLEGGVTLASYGQSGGPGHIAVRATTDPAGLEWQAPVAARLSPPAPGGWNSCGHTEMVPLDARTALLVYADFNHPDSNGVPRKSIMVRRVQVVAAPPSARRLEVDADTVALWRFDEGRGNEAHDACGDPTLTLRAKAAQWGERPGGGAAARFERGDDDATVFIGPKNHDKLHLRTCPEAWTVEARVRYTGPGGRENGHTYVQLCGNDDEGFGLDGVRGGWIFALANFDSLVASGQTADLQAGIAPGARFMGNLRGRDPNHDTSGILFPYADRPGFAYVGVDRGAFIRDHDWHHVAWQFRYADQMHAFFLDGKRLCQYQLPNDKHPAREVINDSENVGVPFTVGGFVHSQNPPYFLGHGNFEGEIADLRISRVLRYPVAEQLSIVKHRGRAADGLALVAGAGLPFEIRFHVDAAQGDVRWKIVAGELPAGLALDPATGTIAGTAATAAGPREVTLEATDAAAATDRHTVAIEVRPGRIATGSLPPAFAGLAYDAALAVEHLAPPVAWKIVAGALPAGLDLDPSDGTLRGTPATTAARTRSTFRVRATDSRGVAVDRELEISVLPAELATIAPDAHTVFLYDWQGEKARLVHDVVGDESLALDWTNMGGDRRVPWPGRAGRFPQETGHGEHGFVSLAKNHDKHNLRTCPDAWTVEAWVRRGGPLLAFAASGPNAKGERFDYGHICGTYDTTKRGVWELYLSDAESPDGSMAVGVHFFGAQPEQALEDLHPWKRPEGIVGDRAGVGIRDTEWHHVAWQYRAADDRHELFLDGRPIWRMRSPDGRRLVNNRLHEAQFSVFTRINGHVIRGHGEDGRFSNHFNYHGWGNFFGQIGEIRVSNVPRYE